MGAPTEINVLVADPLQEDILEGLRAIGLEVVSPERSLSPEELSTGLTSASILVVGDSPVMRGAIERAENLVLIARVGEGGGNVDLAAASDRGIVVTHTPGFDASSRATRLMTAAGMLDAGIGVSAHAGRGLGQSAFGIVGGSPAAIALATAASAMGMRVRAWGPGLTSARASEAGARYVDSLDALLADNNVLCLLDPAGSLDASRVAALPEGAHVLVGHAGVSVDVDGIAKRLTAGTLQLAGLHDSLDDAAQQKLTKTGAAIFLTADQLATHESQRTAGLMVTQSVREMLRHQPASYALNLDGDDGSSTLLIVRHSTEADCVASLFSQLRDGEIAVTHVDNRIFAGGATAISRMRLSGPPGPALMQRLQTTRGVIAADAITP